MAQYEIENAAHPQGQSNEPSLQWTIMIYLAGDNNLSANSIAIMQELEATLSHNDVRVLACFDSNTPRPKGARYLVIHPRRDQPPSPNGNCWDLHNDLVPPEAIGAHAIVAPDFCNPNPSSIKLPDEPVAREGLSRFLDFALRYHRAKKYMLILFGHGSAVAGNTFLADSNPPSFLRLKDFAEVLARHFGGDKQKLDILACHNCVMNGVESAYQIRDQVDYMLGSQGLVLAVGWPYRKIINRVARRPDLPPKRVALRILRVCARSLLDFSLMDRSSEQAVLDLRRFCVRHNIVTAIKRLSLALQEGLEFDRNGNLLHPEIRDAVTLARLQAQSFWDETFVDLYDFCELLLKECNKALSQHIELGIDILNMWLLNTDVRRDERLVNKEFNPDLVIGALRNSDLMKLFKKIAGRCNEVLKEVVEFVPRTRPRNTPRPRRALPYSYYIGAELQYSHGMSIYFPWTLPETPIFFDSMDSSNGSSSGGSYGLPRGQSNDFILKTAFDEYKDYDFAKCSASDWASFLESFFRATLRDVRVNDAVYTEEEDGREFFERKAIDEGEALPVNLRKSGPDVDSELDCTCPKIKNYPRRFYISPADCLRRSKIPGDPEPTYCVDDSTLEEDERNVSYLGWNLRGIAAEVITPQGSNRCPEQPDATDEGPETEPDEEDAAQGEDKVNPV